MAIQNMFHNWSIATNFIYHKGGRILLAWCPASFEVNLVSMSARTIHTNVVHIPTRKRWMLTLVHGFNQGVERCDLWGTLNAIAAQMESPWMVTGDFNSPLNIEDRLGSTVMPYEIQAFRECVEFNELQDIHAKG